MRVLDGEQQGSFFNKVAVGVILSPEIAFKDLGFPEAIAKNYQLPKYTAARPVATQMLKEAFNYAKSEGILHETKDPAKYQLKVVD